MVGGWGRSKGYSLILRTLYKDHISGLRQVREVGCDSKGSLLVSTFRLCGWIRC